MIRTLHLSSVGVDRQAEVLGLEQMLVWRSTSDGSFLCLATSLAFGSLIDTNFDSVSGNADRPISW